MAQSLFGLVQMFLKGQAGEPFTGREIAEGLIEQYPDRLAAKGIQQVAAEISSNYTGAKKRNRLPEQLRVTADSPRKFYWTESDTQTEEELGGNEKEHGSTASDEHGLYPKLIEYLREEFPNMWCWRINEATSSNRKGKGANEWLHPDVVGRQLLSTDWNNEVRDLGKNMQGQKIRLWSFEVKTRLEQGNVRRSFFQAVANSSWANYGYLAAEVVEKEAHAELQLLSPMHGIGLIRIDRRQPSDSQVMLAARERPDFDLAACNRLAKENADFAEIMGVIADEVKTDRPIASSKDSARKGGRSR